MADFSYDPDRGDPLDVVRRLIGDTMEARAIFKDSEIRVFLTLEGPDTPIMVAAGHALLAVANDKAKLTIKSSDGTEQSLSSTATALRQQADRYFDRSENGVVPSVSGFSYE